ncbi:unnamed protein product [Prunus armeniaca]
MHTSWATLDCSNGNDPFYTIGDGDIEMLCSNLLPMQSEQVNAMNMEGAEEQAVEEAVAEEDEVEDDAVDEADTEEVVDLGSPAGVSEKLTSARVPFEGLRACSAYPAGCFGRCPASPKGRCL